MVGSMPIAMEIKSTLVVVVVFDANFTGLPLDHLPSTTSLLLAALF